MGLDSVVRGQANTAPYAMCQRIVEKRINSGALSACRCLIPQQRNGPIPASRNARVDLDVCHLIVAHHPFKRQSGKSVDAAFVIWPWTERHAVHERVKPKMSGNRLDFRNKIETTLRRAHEWQ